MTLAGHAPRRIGLLLAACTLALALGAGQAAASAPAASDARRALIVFYPGPIGEPTVFERLAEREQLSFGLMGATQGAYSVRQTLLDMTQGARLSRSGFDPIAPPDLRLSLDGPAAHIDGWRAALRRARTAPAELLPGLLASRVPGGGAYAGVDGPHSHVEALVAANRRGRLAEVSLGSVFEVADRARDLLDRHRLVVATLPRGRAGEDQLDQLLAQRRPGELVLVTRQPPRVRNPQLLPTGAVGLDPDDTGLLTSRTTRRDGLVTAIDVLPTVFEHLGLPIPEPVRGRPITVTTERGRDVGYVEALELRLRVVYPRRFPMVYGLLISVAIGGLLIGFLGGRRRALRTLALALLWLPLLSLLAAAIEPSRAVERLIVGPGAILLALLVDRLVPWPRAPAVPALLGTVAYVADLAAGSPLIIRSLLGPNPRFGARFYGIGNELEAILPVLLLVGVAAAVGSMPRSRRLAALFAASMLALGFVVGAGRFGADVGGVITIGAGAAAATVLSLPGGPSWRAIAVACSIPVLAVGALAVVDLITGGDAHFSTTVLGADSPAALWDIVERRTSLAVDAFLRGLMPLATLIALAAVVVGYRRRERLFGPVAGCPAWFAALAGGAVGGIVGSLANDSGPVLLVLGMVVVAAGAAYIHGSPHREGGDRRLELPQRLRRARRVPAA